MCVGNSVIWIGAKWPRNFQISSSSHMRASQWRFIIRHHSTRNGSLRLHLYRVRIVHEFLPSDYNQRVAYCQWLLNFVQTRPGMLNDVFYSDEARFQLSEYVNSPSPANLETLKVNITCEINKILRTILMKAAGNVVRRARACILTVGG